MWGGRDFRRPPRTARKMAFKTFITGCFYAFCIGVLIFTVVYETLVAI